jgi:hypothetical protein
MWQVFIIESSNIIGGVAIDVSAELNRLAGEGWTVHFFGPNGINRWTVVCWRDV